MHYRFALALLAIALLGSARAQDVLTLDEAVRLSLTQQPLLESYQSAAAAARERAIADGQLPDPKLILGIQNLPITGDDALHFNRDDMTMRTVGLRQEMVRPAKRAAAANRMESEAQQWEAEYALTTRTVQRDVALAWLDAFEAQRKAELYQRLVAEMAAERQVGTGKLEAGAVQAQELLQLDALVGMTRDKRFMTLRDEKKARAALARWIGAAGTNRPLPAELPAIAIPAQTTSEPDFARHPAIETTLRAQEVAHWEAERARAERAPDWSWELLYGRRQGDRSDMVSLQVSIDLPWDRPQRQDRQLAGKLALVEQARELGIDRGRELAAELASVNADLDTAGIREREYVEHLIPAALARVATAQAGYAAGTTPLSAVWEARRVMLEVELDHWAIRTDRARAAVRLAYLLDDQENNR